MAALVAASLLAATTWEVVLAIVAGLALAALWLIALFLIVLDDRSSGGAKALWLLACILLAPLAVPLYLILRMRRGG